MAPVTPEDEERLARTKMSFGEHLEELRRRVFKALGWTLLGLVVVFIFHEDVMRLVVRPYQVVMADLNRSLSLQVLGVAHGFFAYVKVSFIVALVLTAPLWIYQIWAFIAAGLYNQERRMVTRYIPLCVVLFLSGITFGYFALIPLGLRYLVTFGDPTLINTNITLNEYLSFFTILTLVLGLAFQLPVVMIGLARVGMVTPDTFRKRRRWTILIIFIAAAVLTPPDPVTQCLLAVPLVGLYELGIFMAWMGMGPSRPPLEWRVIWPRIRIALIVLLALLLLREPITGYWLGQKANERLYAGAADGRPDIRAEAGKLLGTPVHHAYRVWESGDVVLVACSTDGGVRVLRLEIGRQQTIPLAHDVDRLAVGFVQTGMAIYDFTVPDEVPYADVVPELLVGLEFGSEAVTVATRALLEGISGEGLGLDDEGARKAFQEWYEAHRDGKMQQRR